jgi:hypothetical protein
VGNVRNPVGPLPSSIYWRRRAVVACLFALIVALSVWAVTSAGVSGGGGRKNSAQGGRTPVSSITPGPTSSQTGITGRPGGRDTSADGGSGDGSGASDAGAGGSGSSAGEAGLSGGPGSGSDAEATTAGAGGSADGSNLPDCTAGQTQLRVRSGKDSYAPGEKPTFEVTAVNSGASACKVNFGATAAVLTVTQASGGGHVWASDDCPAGGAAVPLRVPAGGSAAYRVVWDRSVTAPQCATPSQGRSAQPGTYQVRVSGDGLSPAQASFTLTSS